jgi:hypothetical protein
MFKKVIFLEVVKKFAWKERRKIKTNKERPLMGGGGERSDLHLKMLHDVLCEQPLM